MVITYRTHLKCTHNMCSIWDWWEHFWGVWIVTSTCASYVTAHNSWQLFEICSTIFSKCSYYKPSGNILITWLVLRNIVITCQKLSNILNKFQTIANCYGQLHMRHMLKLQSKHPKNVPTSPRLNTCCGYISNVSYMLLP